MYKNGIFSTRLKTYYHITFNIDKRFQSTLLFSDILATIAPVAASPYIGFGDTPAFPISLIDFHGISDDVIPYDLEHSEGKVYHYA